MISFYFFALQLPLAGITVVRAATTQANQIASLYSLTSSTSLPFPTAPLPPANASTFLSKNNPWSLVEQNGGNKMYLSFVADPFEASDTANPVLQVHEFSTAHSFGGSTGAQFVNIFPNPHETNITSSNTFQSMLLSYDVAFSPNFQWVLGGKLPGLRGGPDITDCGGGLEPKGNGCFSTRLMWRVDGAGEVYAYVQTSDVFCNETGSFSFASGIWNKISLLVRLNFPVNESNGDVQLYYNDQLVTHQTNIQFRNSPAITSVGGVFFSTFFGGHNSTWESPTEQHSYYRNFQLWGSSSPSNNTILVAAPPGMSGAGTSGVEVGSLLLPLVASGLGIAAASSF